VEQSKKRSGTAVGLEKKPSSGRRINALFFAGLAAAVIAALFLLWLIDPGRDSELKRLVGRWQRTGDEPGKEKLLDVRAINADGTVDVRYFNPEPVHEVNARVTMEGGFPRLDVTLPDASYQGSTYTLTYNPAGDELTGVFYQAVEQQYFDVAFKRMAPPPK
jgi:hypothetical protein